MDERIDTMTDYSHYTDYELERLLAITRRSACEPCESGSIIDRVLAHERAIAAIEREIDKRIRSEA